MQNNNCWRRLSLIEHCSKCYKISVYIESDCPKINLLAKVIKALFEYDILRGKDLLQERVDPRLHAVNQVYVLNM